MRRDLLLSPALSLVDRLGARAWRRKKALGPFGARWMGTILRLLGIGWYVALSILGGAVGGTWLDHRLGFGPLFTLLGLSLGIAVAGIGMYRMLMAVLSTSSDSENQGKE